MTPQELNAQGIALAKSAKYVEALSLFDQALLLKPDSAGIHLNRGNALRALRRYQDAVDSYNEVIRLKPDHAGVYNNAGCIMQDLSKFEEALKYYDQAMALDPNIPYLLGNWYSMCMHVCRWEGLDGVLDHIISGILEGKPVITPFIALSVISSAELLKKCAEIHSRVLELNNVYS